MIFEMPLKKESFEALKNYLPENSFDLVMPMILHYKVHLIVTRERQTKLGDYRVAHYGKNHRITVNGNLNRFAFLITLIHEIAHLLAFEQFGHKIAPHGKEWKQTYSGLLKDYLAAGIFPGDVEIQLLANLHNPAASTCAEEHLIRVLRTYDNPTRKRMWVEDLPEGTKFLIKGGRIFEKGEKLRKRIKCYELPFRRAFLFSPLFEIETIL
jgi:SprT protein